MARAKGARPYYPCLFGGYRRDGRRLKLTRSQAGRCHWDPWGVREELAAAHGVPPDDIDVAPGPVRYRGGEQPGHCVDCLWFAGELVPGSAHRIARTRYDGTVYDEVTDLCGEHARRRRDEPYGFGLTVEPLVP